MSQNKRPLSPFMLGSAYRFQITSVMSFLHRLSGISLVLILLVVGCWFGGLATSEEAFDKVNGFISNWFIVPFVVLGTFAACYHFCNGIRHLFWDAGIGIDIPSAIKSGKIVQVTAVLLALFLLYLGFFA